MPEQALLKLMINIVFVAQNKMTPLLLRTLVYEECWFTYHFVWHTAWQLTTARGNDNSFCFIQLYLIYTVLSEFEQLLCCMTPCEQRRDTPWLQSVIPLILSFTTALRVSANAPTLMWERRQPWENTPTLHTFLKIDEKNRLDRSASKEEERWSTMLEPQPKNGSSVMSARWKHRRLSSGD